MSLDAFLMGKYNQSDFAGSSGLNLEYSELYLKWKKEKEMSRILNHLIKETSKKRVRDLGPDNLTPRNLNDKDSLKYVLGLVYRIRSNLVHGGKDIHLRRDRILIHYGFALIFLILDNIYQNEGFVSGTEASAAASQMIGSLADA
jgi:hypothetical protein